MKTFERIYLHIGLHKTGTSSLQSFLFEHRESLLRDLGVLYPSLNRNLSQPLFSLFSEQPQRYAQNIQGGYEDGKLGEGRTRGDVNQMILDTGGQAFSLDEAALRRV